MKKFLKILGIVFGVLAALVIVLIVLAQVLVTPERVKSVVLPKAEEVLHRPISLGKVSVSILSGVTLDQLVVGGKEGAEPFVTADRVVLRYKIWPLFFKRVVIDEVRLIAPHIRVERLADGSFNFSDLLQSEKAGTAVPPEQKSAGSPIDLLVSQVAITGGEVLFLDYRLGTQAPYRYQLADLSLTARDISLQRAFPFQFGARMNEGTLSAEGELNPQTQQGKISLAVTRLDLAAFTPYFKDRVPGQVERPQAQPQPERRRRP